MQFVARSMFMAGMAAAIAGCGGGGGSAPAAAPGSVAPLVVASGPATLTLGPGMNYTLAANTIVYAPANTTISGPNGNVTSLNGSFNTLTTPVGSVISVPASATGAANNTVTSATVASSPTVASGVANVSLVAGSPTNSGPLVDGTGAAAVFWGGGHMALDAAGNLIVADRGALRKVTPAGVVTTFASDYEAADWDGIAIDGKGTIYGSGPSVNFVSTSPVVWGASIYTRTADGVVKTLAKDWLTSPTNSSVGWGGVAVDKGGNLYFADSGNNRIVKFTQDGAMSVFAGGGAAGSSDGKGSAATLNGPNDLVIDTDGNLYFADGMATSIRKVAPDGTVSTYASLKGVLPAGIALQGPIARDPAGTIYAMSFPSTIVRIDSKGAVKTYTLGQMLDSVASMVADANGKLYLDTRGFGAQILKVSF